MFRLNSNLFYMTGQQRCGDGVITGALLIRFSGNPWRVRNSEAQPDIRDAKCIAKSGNLCYNKNNCTKRMDES